MEEFLREFEDLGIPQVILMFLFRFWPQVTEVLRLGRAAVRNGQARARIFASQTLVIATRPVWRVILPLLVLAALVSAGTMINMVPYLSGWGLQLAIVSMIVKGIAGLWALIVTVRAHRVRVDGTGPTWFFMPMMTAVLYAPALLWLATLGDTFALADQVGYFTSLLVAMVSVAMLVLAIVMTLAGVLLVALLSLIGVEMGTSGWNGFVLPVATGIIPFLTAANNAALRIPERANTFAELIIQTVLRIWLFIVGVLLIWALFFISFHSPLEFLIEGVLTTAWLLIMTSWLATTTEFRVLIAKRVLLTFITLGGVFVHLRIVDALVAPRVGEVHQAVMFYDRFSRFAVGAFDFMGTVSPAMFAFYLTMFAAGVALAYYSSKLHKHESLSHTMLWTGVPIIAIALVALVFQGAATAYHYDDGSAPPSHSTPTVHASSGTASTPPPSGDDGPRLASARAR